MNIIVIGGVNMTLKEYGKYMQAPHRMDLMVSSMMKDNMWNCNQKCLHCYANTQEKAIVEEFEKQFGIKLDKRKMDLEEPIRGLGMARVPIHLHPEVVATISVQIKEK